MKVSLIDEMIKLLSDSMCFFNEDINRKISDLIDIFIEKKIEIMKGWNIK